MGRVCVKCGKKEGLLVRINENNICDACYAKAIDEEVLRKSKISSEQSSAEDEKKKEPFIKYLNEIKNIIVTTTDLREPYNIITPIIYTTTNRGIFSSMYTNLCKKYSTDYKQLLIIPALSPNNTGVDGTFLLSLFDGSIGYEGNVGQANFDYAYYMCIAEMKIRAHQVGGDAIVGLRMDFDLDTTNLGAFYLQMYGTVVKKNSI